MIDKPRRDLGVAADRGEEQYGSQHGIQLQLLTLRGDGGDLRRGARGVNGPAAALGPTPPERGASALWAVTIGCGERLVDESGRGIRLAINGPP